VHLRTLHIGNVHRLAKNVLPALLFGNYVEKFNVLPQPLRGSTKEDCGKPQNS
jgi:hypothetical protein